MAKIEITKTELIWPGKYNEDGTRRDVPRASLPFQVIETINESRAARDVKNAPQAVLFDIYRGTEGETVEEGWKNKLIWGDNLLVTSSLLQKFAGKIDLIYIDPPFATGADFSFATRIGDEDIDITKEQSSIEEKAYRDTWGGGIDSYVAMMFDRLSLLRELLSPDGTLYVHCDWRVNSALRFVLDEVFGRPFYKAVIIWQKLRSVKSQSSHFANMHDTILVFAKSDSPTFNPQFVEKDAKLLQTHYRHTDPKTGRRFNLADFTQAGAGAPRQFGDKTIAPPPGKHWIWSQERIDEALVEGLIVFSKSGMPYAKRFFDEGDGTRVGDIWTDINPVNQVATERVDYATQKPEALLERIIKASSKETALIADFFCGSGTTLAVAEKLGHRWIGCDLGRYAVHTTRKRLLGIEHCRPFEILNLGKYERQYWQGVTFSEKGKDITEKALYEYLAFILKLYGAQPVAGLAQLHGKKGRAMVHIGAVDAPVTIDEINAAISECVQLKQSELHILGWEWEMGVNDLMVPEAKKQGIKLLLLQIPREVMEQQAVDKGDIEFFELAYLEVEIEKPRKLTTRIKLKAFIIPNTELIPEEVRSKVKKWSDYIDYWAIDWDFQNDTFMQGWVNYRTRRDRSLALVSDEHTYEKAGAYRVLVKVVDIFGNDTTQAFDVNVK